MNFNPTTPDIREALTKAYALLHPYSLQYKIDYERYLVSLSLITSIPNIEKKEVLDIGTGIAILPLALILLGIKARGIDHYVFSNSGDGRFAVNDFSLLKSVWNNHSLVIDNFDISISTSKPSLGEVDVIVSEATIEHLKDPKNFLEICNGLLAHSGILVLSTPNSATLIKRLRFLFGLTPNWPIEDFYQHGSNFTGHWREYTMRELIYMLKSSGFVIKKKETKNVLAKFSSNRSFRKNLRVFINLFSYPFSGMREIHYVLAEKR